MALGGGRRHPASRPRRPPGRRRPCSSSRSGSILPCVAGVTGRVGCADLCRLLLERVPDGLPLRARRQRAGDPPLRDDRDGARPRLPLAALLTRGRARRRSARARRLEPRRARLVHRARRRPHARGSRAGASLAAEARRREIALGVATELARTQETLELALEGAASRARRPRAQRDRLRLLRGRASARVPRLGGRASTGRGRARRRREPAAAAARFARGLRDRARASRGGRRCSSGTRWASATCSTQRQGSLPAALMHAGRARDAAPAGRSSRRDAPRRCSRPGACARASGPT